MHTVTRQINTFEGTNVVEISAGGIDYTNPGALSKKYPGEFETFDDPRDAVETAIKIAKAWQNDTEDKVFIDHGATGGMTMFFDGQELTDTTFTELREWANKEWEELDKCAECGELLGKERYGCHISSEYDCCSEYCAEQRYYMQEDDEDDEEE